MAIILEYYNPQNSQSRSQKMDFFKRFVCCFPGESKEAMMNYERIRPAYSILEGLRLTEQTEINKIQEPCQPKNQEQPQPQLQSPQLFLPPTLNQLAPKPLAPAYYLGFLKKPYQTQTTYLMRHIAHQPLPTPSPLLCQLALATISNKLSSFRNRIFFYCMCVPGANSCSRSQLFLTTLQTIPLHLIYLTLQTNLRPCTKSSAILPILSSPSSIRSLHSVKDHWIILDFGQHSPTDNYIRQHSPSYTKIVPIVAQTFAKCNNVVIVFPSGITRGEIFDLHTLVFQEFTNNVFNFDVELETYEGEGGDGEGLCIGFYGEGIRLKMRDFEEAYPRCIIDLFDEVLAEGERQRMQAVFEYLIEGGSYEEVLGMLCEMRAVDNTPQNIVRGVYSRVKEIAEEKGVRLVLQAEGEDTYSDLFERMKSSHKIKQKEIGDTTKRKNIVEMKLSHNDQLERQNEREDYLYQRQFFKKKSWVFSKEFQPNEERSSESEEEFDKSQDSIFN